MKAVVFAGAGVVFVLDLVVPLGMAVAVPYVAVVLLTLWLPDRRAIFRVAGVITVLAVAGFFSPFPEGPLFGIALHNRAVSLVVIWATAVLGNLLVREQERTRRERDFNESLVETASSVILLLDTNGRIEHLNRYTALVIGCTLAEVEGTDWFDAFVPERERRVARRLFRRSTESDCAQEGQFPLVGRDGSVRQFSWSFKAMRDATGRVERVLLLGQEITALVEAQRRAVASERLAAIGQTIATLSHESRNELNVLQIGLGLLSSTTTDSKVRELAGHMQNGLARLQRLFEDVRNFAGPIRLERSNCLLSGVWRRAWSSLEPVWREREVELEEHIDGEVRCPVDALRVEQVFRNLFENSLAACPDPVRVEVRCSASSRGGRPCLRVSVGDNGPGLSPEARAKVFEPFYTTKRQGTGLGMAISRRIVAAHGGELSLGRADSAGAEFVILLPLERPEGEDTEARPHVPRSAIGGRLPVKKWR